MLKYIKNLFKSKSQFNSEPFIKRLVKEWKKHNEIIIAVDYDDTIKKWSIDRDYDYTINLIKKAQIKGAYLIIWTASNVNDRKQSILEYCDRLGLRVDSINENKPNMPYGHFGKVYANLFIDDRAGVNESLFILDETLKRLDTNLVLSEERLTYKDRIIDCIIQDLKENPNNWTSKWFDKDIIQESIRHTSKYYLIHIEKLCIIHPIFISKNDISKDKLNQLKSLIDDILVRDTTENLI